MKTLRTPFISILLLFTLFSISCDQSDSDRVERNFDYTILQEFQQQSINISNFDFQGNRNLDLKSKLQNVNAHFGTELSIPDHILNELENPKSSEELKAFILEENLLSSQSLTGIENFVRTAEKEGFDLAFDQLEQDFLRQDVSNEEFKTLNNIANMLQIMHHEKSRLAINPIFNTESNINRSSAIGYYGTNCSGSPMGTFSSPEEACNNGAVSYSTNGTCYECEDDNTGGGGNGGITTLTDCLVNYVLWISSLNGYSTQCNDIANCLSALLAFSVPSSNIIEACGQYYGEYQSGSITISGDIYYFLYVFNYQL